MFSNLRSMRCMNCKHLSIHTHERRIYTYYTPACAFPRCRQQLSLSIVCKKMQFEQRYGGFLNWGILKTIGFNTKMVIHDDWMIWEYRHWKPLPRHCHSETSSQALSQWLADESASLPAGSLRVAGKAVFWVTLSLLVIVNMSYIIFNFRQRTMCFNVLVQLHWIVWTQCTSILYLRCSCIKVWQLIFYTHSSNFSIS